MPKPSAGIIAYRCSKDCGLQLLLVHPGGPFFTKKDAGVWSIPKGEYEPDEDPFTVALREFEEETGNKITPSNAIELTRVKTKSGKLISTWAIEADFEKCFIESNMFTMEWPPKSGRQQSFPETDDAAWFTPGEAKLKMTASQLPILEEFIEKVAR